MRTVLIVEDNATNADVLTRRLRRRSMSIHHAENGRIGLDMAKALKPDIILMDIGMPEMDGIAATRALRADEDTRSIPIIAITASAFEADRENAYDAGVDAFETKPVDMDKLMMAIERLAPEN
jgi:CheY-like chemotaxis protein